MKLTTIMLAIATTFIFAQAAEARVHHHHEADHHEAKRHEARRHEATRHETTRHEARRHFSERRYSERERHRYSHRYFADRQASSYSAERAAYPYSAWTMASPYSSERVTRRPYAQRRAANSYSYEGAAYPFSQQTMPRSYSSQRVARRHSAEWVGYRSSARESSYSSRHRYRYAAESRGRSHLGGRPAAWCGWEMRQLVSHDPGTSFNLARNWAHWGHAGPAGVGAVVVWPHHVGKIVGQDHGMWVVESGNDGHRIRTRPRSTAGAIAYRWG